LISFFLPWLKVSCGSKDMEVSGWSMGGVFWIIFISALLALLAYIVFRPRIRTLSFRSIMLASALASACTIIYKYLAVARDPDIPFYVPSSMVKFELKTGALGTILGLLMVLAGAFIYSKKKIEVGNRKADGRSPEQGADKP